eukprot:TRINITY_DN55799_c0_g1_i1.p1 TRINITY_DN55799_c0_g1~~TRINITY_DN55799_c0_g1_i1.p1  ORF type:complete len:327 (-),score=31.41 TRINITY_DN55799_c0_g1_i1:619-1599(-)
MWDDEVEELDWELVSPQHGRSISTTVNRLEKDLNKANKFLQSTTWQKVLFTYGVLNIVLSNLALQYHPKYLTYAYGIKLIFYLSWRIASYWWQRYIYFMLDFCYFANLIVLLTFFVFSNNLMLFKVSFAMTTGPLLFAIIAWRNSLVFHSIDKMTSIFIHITPTITIFHWRWWNGGTLPSGNPIPADSFEFVRDGLIVPIIAYCVWQTLYYIKVYWLDKKKLENDEQQQFSTRYIFSTKRGLIYNLSLLFGERWQLQTFIGLQLVYTAVTLLPVWLCWHYYIVHCIMLLGTFGVCAWNGAGWYIHVFANIKYKQLRKELALDQQEK